MAHKGTCALARTTRRGNAVSSATFGRPHALLLLWLEWGTWLGLRAVRTRRARYWTLAGGVLGSSVFVHPTAPLYAQRLLELLR